MNNQACHEPYRAFLYERLTSFFLKDEEFTEGKCAQCGTNVQVNATGRCRAQAALTQKRFTAAEGHPIAFGSPVLGARGAYAITDKLASILVTQDKAVFTGKVLPSSPLPANVSVRNELRFEDLLEEVVFSPLAGRYLIALFAQKADMPFAWSCGDEIMVNGSTKPERLDRRRLQRLIELTSEFGETAMDLALALKRAISFDPGSAMEKESRLIKAAPGLRQRLAEIPNGGPEIAHAYAIINNRARRAQQESA